MRGGVGARMVRIAQRMQEEEEEGGGGRRGGGGGGMVNIAQRMLGGKAPVGVGILQSLGRRPA